MNLSGRKCLDNNNVIKKHSTMTKRQSYSKNYLKFFEINADRVLYVSQMKPKDGIKSQAKLRFARSNDLTTTISRHTFVIEKTRSSRKYKHNGSIYQHNILPTGQHRHLLFPFWKE